MPKGRLFRQSRYLFSTPRLLKMFQFDSHISNRDPSFLTRNHRPPASSQSEDSVKEVIVSSNLSLLNQVRNLQGTRSRFPVITITSLAFLPYSLSMNI